MMPLAEDVARHLALLGVGAFGGAGAWGLYAHDEPDTPDSVITVYGTGGAGPDTDELDLMDVTFQVRVRSMSYEDANEKIEIVRDLLMLGGRVVTTNSAFVHVTPQSDVLPLGRDDLKRFVLTQNFRAIRERT